MDRNAGARKRRQDAGQPTSKPPVRIVRDKRLQQEVTRKENAGKIRSTKDSTEIARLPRKRDLRERPSHDEDPNARHFTVANVGRNGTLYLKPARMTHAQYMQAPATPPGSSDGVETSVDNEGVRHESNASGTWTPFMPTQDVKHTPTVPMPPLSMANSHQRKRTRSHSFSAIGDAARSATRNSSEIQLLLNGHEPGQRPKSSVDLSDGLLNTRIPHYRLGTPRFRESGTAYLHSSIYTSNSEDMRSSVLSKVEYDRMFPVPPGGVHRSGFRTRNSSAGTPYLHPSSAAYSTPPSKTQSNIFLTNSTGDMNVGLYDRIEANINDASFVRYSPSTGRIAAATPARLIAQITSPIFLDYELLADFFLTYRSFLPRHELLDYLLTRMKWALANDVDAGRIVRVRTFVALRHWILNYFTDDFIPDFWLRQRFCNLVNELVKGLRLRQDRGGTDMNVIGELKKCWRRTCATFWPVEDALDTSPDADLLPGDEKVASEYGASTTSLGLSQRNQSSQLDFRRSSVIQLPIDKEVGATDLEMRGFNLDEKISGLRKASIPTSPMSENSLTVLSCSVPFLRHMKDHSHVFRPLGPQRNPPLPKKSERPHQHKRSGSFSDALRDERTPLPSGQPESVDIRSLPSVTFTGGLVRGLLLQPCPSNVDILLPLSPTADTQDPKAAALETSSVDRHMQNPSVKKIVGDVRRVFTTRKRSPSSSHQSTNSSDSRISGQALNDQSALHSQPLQGPPRVDILGEKIEGSYKEAFIDASEATAVDSVAQAEKAMDLDDKMTLDKTLSPVLTPDLKRLNSHVTTGSRSIVIVDDTGMPEMPETFGALPSVSSWSSGMAPKPLFRSPEIGFDQIEEGGSQSSRGMSTAVASEGDQLRSSEPRHHEFPPVSNYWRNGSDNGNAVGSAQARKSSSAHPPAFEVPQAHHQLRKRPGGDLKAADYVHDLEPAPRPETGDSYSTFSQAIASSGPPSNDLSGTHFSGQGFKGFRFPRMSSGGKKRDSMGLLPTHSSQPNMRPSFEKEVSGLAKLSDRANDGGIEDALAKLEGKSPSPNASQTTVAEHDTNSEMPPLARQPRSQQLRLDPDAELNGKPNVVNVDDADLRSPRTDRQGASIYHMSDSDGYTDVGAEQQPQKEEDADDEVADEDQLPVQGTHLAESTNKAVAFASPDGGADVAAKTERSGKVQTPENASTSQGSFLLDDDESLSDISTEIAEHSGDESLGVRSFFFDDTVEDDIISTVNFHHPPSPPLTIEPAANVSPDLRTPIQRGPTSQPQRTLKEAASAPKVLVSKKVDEEFHPKPNELRRVRTSPSRRQLAHLPFVLAYDSEVIAEQLTIIEKDALDEVDWRDLIGLNWQHSPSNCRNWVDFLKKDGRNGIDLVVARFNLAAKWVVSQCILTEAPSERARCVSKYIHVAIHAHRLRNYASMYQITLALLSADLARLHQTWSLVPPADKQMLERLEKLCQPRANFQLLRAEMEAVAMEKGCIPFIGLYTHDLMFNAQKPSRIDPVPPSREPLINFERYQTAATIVKSLLRLIEASSKYVFRPHPEVLSRCLWLASLEDHEITARSKTLEQ